MLQTCKRCRLEKPVEAFEIRSDTKKPRGTCRQCKNARAVELYPNRAEQAKAATLRWRAEHREQHLAYNREYGARNKEARNARSLQWARENKEIAGARSAAWREANRESVKAAARELRAENPEKYRAKTRNRRARVKAGGEHSASDVALIFAEQGGKCAGCNRWLIESGYHVDHVFAVANGGHNGAGNLQLLCPTCNVSKGTKNLMAWMISKGYALP